MNLENVYLNDFTSCLANQIASLKNGTRPLLTYYKPIISELPRPRALKAIFENAPFHFSILITN